MKVSLCDVCLTKQKVALAKVEYGVKGNKLHLCPKHRDTFKELEDRGQEWDEAIATCYFDASKILLLMQASLK